MCNLSQTSRNIRKRAIRNKKRLTKNLRQMFNSENTLMSLQMVIRPTIGKFTRKKTLMTMLLTSMAIVIKGMLEEMLEQQEIKTILTVTQLSVQATSWLSQKVFQNHLLCNKNKTSDLETMVNSLCLTIWICKWKK